MLSRPPVLTTIRMCFSSEHNPACERRFQRNRTPEAPPDLEDLSGKWKARGQTRGETRVLSLWLTSHTDPQQDGKGSQLTMS